MSGLLLLLRSASTPAVVPANTVLPSAVGLTRVGSTLAATVGTWTGSPTGYTYQWQRSPTGTVWTDIASATGQAYTLVTADLGNLVRVRVTASNSAGSASAFSSGLGPIAAAIIAVSHLSASVPALVAELDFVGGPSGISSVWTDISRDVRGSITIGRGRNNPLDRIEAGQVTAQVDNSTRRYEPEYAGSPYYPNIRPRVGFRLRAVYNGVIYPLHRGLIQSWPITWPEVKRSFAGITSVDAFAQLTDARVTPQTFPLGLSGAQIATFLDQAAFPSTRRALDAGQETLLGVDASRDYSNPPDVLGLVQDSADSELGLFFINPDGNAVFHDRDRRVTAARSLTTQASFSDDPNQGLPYLSPEPDYGIERVYNDVRVTSGITNALPQIALDTASRDRYGLRTLPRSTRLATDAAAAAQAARILSDSKDPHLRFPTITLDPTRDARLWPVVLGIEISDRVVVFRTPYGGGGTITKACWVEAVRHDITYSFERVTWRTTLSLSLADPSVYFVLDDPVRGALDSAQIR